MKKDWSHLDKYRQQVKPYHSPPGATYGSFSVQEPGGIWLNIIAVDGRETGWEHVSVHAYDARFGKMRTPKWDEMCVVKKLFWEDDEIVIQWHVAQSDWISIHDHVLHLWRNTRQTLELPPKEMV